MSLQSDVIDTISKPVPTNYDRTPQGESLGGTSDYNSSSGQNFGESHAFFNINAFIANISKNPLLIANKYHCVITGPDGIFPDSVSMNIVNVNLPTRTLATVEKFVYGPSTKIPYVETFDDLAITFRSSADLYEKKLLDLWMTKIGGRHYGCAYFDEIKGSVLLDIYHRNNQKMKTYKFFDAVPVNIGEIPLSDSSEEIATFVVQFAYHHYE